MRRGDGRGSGRWREACWWRRRDHRRRLFSSLAAERPGEADHRREIVYCDAEREREREREAEAQKERKRGGKSKKKKRKMERSVVKKKCEREERGVLDLDLPSSSFFPSSSLLPPSSAFFLLLPSSAPKKRSVPHLVGVEPTTSWLQPRREIHSLGGSKPSALIHCAKGAFSTSCPETRQKTV